MSDMECYNGQPGLIWKDAVWISVGTTPLHFAHPTRLQTAGFWVLIQASEAETEELGGIIGDPQGPWQGPE